MKTMLSLCFAACFVTACNFAPAVVKNDSVTVEHIVLTDTIEIPDPVIPYGPLAGPVTVPFSDGLLVCTFTLTDPAIVDENPDTLFISPSELGETLAGATFNIQSDSLSDIVVEQSYQTVSGISNEGPVCLLEGWKNYRSGWVKVEGKNGEYLGREYTEKDMFFPETDIEEWKKVVKKHCGKEYLELVKDNKTVKENAAFVGIEIIYFRITGKKKDGTDVIKYIAFYPAIGC